MVGSLLRSSVMYEHVNEPDARDLRTWGSPWYYLLAPNGIPFAVASPAFYAPASDRAAECLQGPAATPEKPGE